MRRGTWASLTLAILLASACSAWEPASSTPSPAALSSDWRIEQLPGRAPTSRILALRREATRDPPLFRLLVIPGSGCSGFATFADKYFRGLSGAQVIVLHKPHVDLFAGPAPAACSSEFLLHDALGSWRDDAIAALRQLSLRDSVAVPTILLGISEGAEIAPYLLPEISKPIGLVLLSATGLDPAIAGELQAERLGQGPAWKRLMQAVASAQSDETIVEGRSLRYWRGMFGWKLTTALAEVKLPVLRVWGGEDALLPQKAYDRLRALPAAKAMNLCDWRIDGADHGLQGRRGDGVQLLWQRLEAWVTAGRLDCRGEMGQQH
jgi:alpha-beta hydrolase superfamily lysophospholipase